MLVRYLVPGNAVKELSNVVESPKAHDSFVQFTQEQQISSTKRCRITNGWRVQPC